MTRIELQRVVNGGVFQRIIVGVTSAALLGAMAGCAGPIPTERLQSSAAAIRAAEEVGASRVPQAQLHLQLAKEQSDQAKKMIDNDGDREEAALILTRAEADANLALALARTSQEQQQAKVAMDKVHALKTQNGDK